MIPRQPNLAKHCRCGASLAWEQDRTMGPSRSLAVCRSDTCGVIHGPSDCPSALQDFLVGARSPQPYATPWLRCFLAASRIANTEGWRPAGEPCWSCGGEDLNLSFAFQPILTPQSVTLCLRCGALTATYNGSGSINQATGQDWTHLTGPVGDFRRAVRQRQALADEMPPADHDCDLWDE